MSPETPVVDARTFNSVLEGAAPTFLAGGFECSSHRRSDGVRLDLLKTTRHAQWAHADYNHLADLGVKVARDGVRWHLIEAEPGRYDMASILDLAKAAQSAGVQVIWDLCHYGWPDHVDIWAENFAERFADFAAYVAAMLRAEFGAGQVYCPLNEISFIAWAGGEMGRMNPCAKKRGNELKRVLVRAAVAATRAVRAVDAAAMFICAEPLIHVAPLGKAAAEKYRLSQFEALDMLLGLSNPELGGSLDVVDVVGLNFYPQNQWFFRGSTIPMGHHAYRPLGDMLAEVHLRYGKPLFIAETGAEGRARSYWLHHVTEEVLHALAQGVPVLGVCLYPVLDYPGWENGRVCEVGLLSEADRRGCRTVYDPLMNEVRRAQDVFRSSWRHRQRHPSTDRAS